MYVTQTSATFYLTNRPIKSYKKKLVIPEIMPFTFGDVYEGEVSQVGCVLSRGDPPIRIEWFHNDQLLVTSDEISIIATGTRGSVLLIQSLSPHHMGNYTCVASNRAASSSYTAPLIINGSIEMTNENLRHFQLVLLPSVSFCHTTEQLIFTITFLSNPVCSIQIRHACRPPDENCRQLRHQSIEKKT